MAKFNSNYYKAVCESMEKLAKHPKTIFLGQTVLYSGRMYGTLDNIPKGKCIELPIAEEMQLGMSIGLSFAGYIPVSIYQRMDFLPRAMDQLVNHLNLIEEMSQKQFKPKVIIRTTIGSKRPLDTGLQHSKDLTDLFIKACDFPVVKVETAKQVRKTYREAIKSDMSYMVIEVQDLYN